MMKKTVTLMTSLLLALVGLHTHAAIYIVGMDPFGGWDPNAGVEMTLENGVYTYTVTIDGSVYFVFADGLDSDWASFNNNYRYGPTDGDQRVHDNEWVTTQKSSDNGAYLFQGSGDTYTFTFDEANHQFRIEGYVDPLPPVMTYTIAGSKAVFGSEWDATDENNDMTKGNDGLYTWTKENVALDDDFEFKIVCNHDWFNSWPADFADNYIVNVTEPGIYTIVITFDPNDEEITCNTTWTSSLPNPVYGDLDGDGSVNVADLTFLIDCILGFEQNMDCDLDGDGSINIADVTLLIDIIITTHPQ